MTAGRKSTWLILGAILLLGLGLRAAYLVERAQAPDFSVPLRDAAFHDYWARGIAFGEWTPPAGDPDPRIPEVPFLRPPGYPYFLAGVYAAGGGSPLAPRIAQMLLGLLNVILAFLLARTVAGRLAGYLLAGFCAVYWTLIYFEGELQAPVLIVTLGLALLLCLARWRRRPSGWMALFSGVTLGLLALTRANALAFLPVAMLWVVWIATRADTGEGTHRERRARSAGPARPTLGRRTLARRALGQTALLALGTLLAIAPATLRNALVAGDFVAISVNGEINLLIGNNEASTATNTALPDLEAWTGTDRWNFLLYDAIVRGLAREQGRELSYSEAGDLFIRRALDFIRAHPGLTARRWLERAALFWGPAEISNNKTIALEKSHSAILGVQPGFPLVLAPALLGLILLRAGHRRLARRSPEGDRRLGRRSPAARSPGVPDLDRPLLALTGLYVLTYFATFLPFIAAARFRAPLLPMIALFGAYGIVRIYGLIRVRMWTAVAAAGAIGVGLYLLAAQPWVAYGSDPAWWHTERATALARGGNPEAARGELLRALEANPGFVDAHVKLAAVLTQLGRYGEALEHYNDLLRHRPGRDDLRLQRAALSISAGAPNRALADLRQLTEAYPSLAGPHYQLGRAHVMLGGFEEAERSLRRALGLDSTDARAHLYLGIALASQGDLSTALAHYRQAVELAPQVPEGHFNLGLALEQLGDPAAAAQAYRQALQLHPEFHRARLQLETLAGP